MSWNPHPGFYLYQHFKRTNSLKPGFEVHFLTFSKPFEAGRRRSLKLTRCFKEFNIYLLYLLYWCMTFVDLLEFCNRKASKCRSINNRTNHSIFRWFLPHHWLFLDLLCFVWYISFRFVSFSFLSLVVPQVITSWPITNIIVTT